MAIATASFETPDTDGKSRVRTEPVPMTRRKLAPREGKPQRPSP